MQPQEPPEYVNVVRRPFVERVRAWPDLFMQQFEILIAAGSAPVEAAQAALEISAIVLTPELRVTVSPNG